MSNGGQKRHPLTDILNINGYGLDMSANSSGDLVVKLDAGKLGLFIQAIHQGVLEYCSDDREALLAVDRALETCVTVLVAPTAQIVIRFPGVPFYAGEDEPEEG